MTLFDKDTVLVGGVVGGLAALSFLYFLGRGRSSRSDIPLVPIAPLSESSLLWGHEYQVHQAGVGVKFLEWAMSISKVFRIKTSFFDQDTLVLTDHAAVHHMLNHGYRYTKSPAHRELFARFVGTGLAWADGDIHKHLRKAMGPAFTANAIRDKADDTYMCTDKLIQRLLAEIQQGSKRVNIFEHTTACTVEIFARIGFGYSMPHDSEESITLRTAWRNDSQIICSFIGFFAMRLIQRAPIIAKLSRQDGAAKVLLENIGLKMVKDVEEGRRSVGLDENGQLQKDFLSLLMRNDAVLSKDHILGNIITFFIGGFETTAQTISFIVFELGRNPASQTKLRAELSTIDVSNYETLDQLPYLDAIIREGLRLYPPAKDMERIAHEDDIIPLQVPIKLTNGKTVSSLRIAAGDRFTIPPLPMNTNPDVWGPDAFQFKPERWLTQGGIPELNDLPKGLYNNTLSFSEGPKGCIGWRLAIMEMKIIVAKLVLALEFSDKDKVQIQRLFAGGVTPLVDNVAGEIPVHISVAPIM